MVLLRHAAASSVVNVAKTRTVSTAAAVVASSSSPIRLKLLTHSARPCVQRARPFPSSLTPAVSLSTTRAASASPAPLPAAASSTFAPLRPALPRVPPRLSTACQSKRHCSYRRMCRSAGLMGDDGTASGGAVAMNREVLPTNVKPLHYDVTLEPDFEKFTYSGTVVIEYVLSYLLYCGDPVRALLRC